MCDCIEKTNEALAGKGLRLGLTIFLSSRPAQPTLLIEKLNKKAKKVTITLSYCPFCGTKYKE